MTDPNGSSPHVVTVLLTHEGGANRNGSSVEHEVEELRASCDTLPADPDAEAALIGAALINRPAAVVVAGVALEDYFVQRNATIASAIRDVVAEAETPDPVLVHDALRLAGHHEIGLADLHELFAITPAVSSARRYAAIIRRHARHRRVVHLAHELSGAAMRGQQNEIGRIVAQLVVEITDDEEAAQ